MKEELVSAIIPTYNVEKYIGRCIESILKQTYTDFEMIIVDDGSDDKTIKICNEYRVRDNRIKIIQLDKHSGVAVARNTGLDEAIGEYIAFVDADDYVVEDYFEVLYKNLKWVDADISVCSYVNVADNEQIIREQENNECKINVFQGNRKYYALYINEKMSTSTSVCWGKIYRSRIFENLRYKINSCHEDMFLVHQILKKAGKIVYTDKVGYFYVRRKGSTINNFTIESLDFLDSEYDRIEFFTDIVKNEELYNISLNNCCKSIIIYYCKLKKYIKDSSGEADKLHERYRYFYNNVSYKNKKLCKVLKSTVFKDIKFYRTKLFLFYHIPEIYSKIINKFL